MTHEPQRDPGATQPRIALIMVLVAVAVAAAVYARLLPAPFLSWDDDRNIVLNPLLRGADFGALWTAPWFGLYVPVTSTMWAILWQVGGGSAVAFRLGNLVLHAATTVMVWRLLVRLGQRAGAAPPADQSAMGVPVEVAAAVGASIFALHPMQTAAVAWISGGRDLLATFLAVGALLIWLRGTKAAAVVATAVFALALLAKPSVAAVPLAVLAGAAVTGFGPFRRSAPVMTVWIAMAAVVALVTKAIQTDMTGLVVPIGDRPVIAIDAIGFYILKLLAPLQLAADHGRTPEALAANARWLVPTMAAAAASAVLLVGPSRRRSAAAAWAAAGVALFLPVLGVVPFAYQRISTVADHYAYLPMVAVAGLVSVLTAARMRRIGTAWTAWVVVVVVYGSLCWNRVGVWRNDRFFFTDMVQHNPTSFSGLTNLAKIACDAGVAPKGIVLTRQALAVNAANPATLATRADCLYRDGAYGAVVAMRARLASPEVQFTLSHDDAAAASFVNSIAGALFQRGDLSLGLIHLCQAIALRPGDDYLRENLADISSALARRGRDVECSGRLLPWAALGSLDAKPEAAAR